MLISVIIPAYNRTGCIRRALESVRAQGLADFEVILGDDASTDGTAAAVLEMFAEARIARLEKNSGAAAARNAALKLARGDFLAFLDSDDEWLPGKLEQQIEYLRTHPECGVCATGHYLKTKEGEVTEFPGANPSDWSRELQVAQSFHGASTPVVRRSILETVGFQDEELRVLEDWDWMLRIAQKYPIHVLPPMLAVIHENNPSNPDFTLRSMEFFLAKHHDSFLKHGRSYAASVIAQHEENTARTLVRHGRIAEGVGLFWQSWIRSPFRNPALLAVFPMALWDRLSGGKSLPELLEKRGRKRLRHVSTNHKE